LVTKIVLDKSAINYKPGAFGGTSGGETRTIDFPGFDASGHAVEMSQPVDLLNAVKAWLGS
jgi:hypothetical protein